MGIQAVSHIAIGVRDMDAAVGFYRDVLGLRVTADQVEEFPQKPGEAPARRRAVYLRWEDGPHASFVVLDQQLARPAAGAPAQLFQVGCHHFAFWVDDLDDMLTRVRAAGVPVVMGGEGPGAGTEMYGEPPGGFVRSVFLRDPEGNFVQLDQRV